MNESAEPDGGARSMLDRLMEVGVGGLVLKPGDHICAFYRGPAGRDEILTPYIAQGLQDGDKCICFLDVADRTEVKDRLQASLPESDRVPGQLEVLDYQETYLREGRFNQEEWFEFLDRSVSGAISGEGYTVARAAGEMAWALRNTPGVEELCSYEAMVNWFAPRYPQILMCFYDLDRFSGEIVVDVLKTHPKVLLNNMVVENPYYMEPAAFLAQQKITV
ncbi:MAG TPA: MEDS domain-containing protein [Candidatus Dormibacteraeota bacterium]